MVQDDRTALPSVHQRLHDRIDVALSLVQKSLREVGDGRIDVSEVHDDDFVSLDEVSVSFE